ncbi:unnamed protein product, partial [Polarella glacialis]
TMVGRTHQIKVHLRDAGHPVLGDRDESQVRKDAGAAAYRLFLHATRLDVPLPEHIGVVSIEDPHGFDSQLVDAAEQVAERRCAPWRAQAAALLDVDLLQEALRRWGSADFEEAAAGLRQRCPALEASTETADGAENQVSARIAQLDFLVDTGAMSGADCLQMVTSWPECLSDFTIRQVWAQDDLVAVNKPFNRLMYCKKRLPREVPVADWLKTGFQGQGQARLCHRLDYG